MAAGVIYLEVDDEITSAAARIRRAEGSRVAVVLPNGSRVATSRINFRLLSRDAMTHEKRLSIVAPDGATRALAASAGLPVFASVAEYEASLEEPAGHERGGGPGGSGATPPAEEPGEPGEPAPPTSEGDDSAPTTKAARRKSAGAAAAGAAAAGAAAAGGAAPGPAAAAGPAEVASGAEAAGGAAPSVAADAAADVTRRVRLPDSPPRRAAEAPPPGPATSIPVVGSRRPTIPRAPVLVGAAVLALAILVAGVSAYALLPAATVAVTPHEKVIGPLRFSVAADETATEPDASRRVVPAERLTIDVAVEGTFTATGQRVEQTRASGRVTFQSFDTGGSNTIRSGSIVSTEGGIRFRTLGAVTLPPAEVIQGNQAVVRPSSRSVSVEAVRQGPNGNVPANAITVVPSNENPTITKVRNGDPTAGGTREEFPLVEAADIENAIADLDGQLADAFADRLSDPTIVPANTTLFPGTAMLGEATPTVDPEELIGTEVEQFDLGLTADGSVVAVNPAPVTAIAETLLLGEIEDDHDLVEGSTEITTGEPVVSGQTVSFPVVAEARQVQIPDAAELEALILGKPLEEARRLLAQYGEVELTLWPDWVTSVPTIDGRVELEIRSPLPVEGGSTPQPPSSPPPQASPSIPPESSPS